LARVAQGFEKDYLQFAGRPLAVSDASGIKGKSESECLLNLIRFVSISTLL
jgi:hypothetical protein